MPARAAASAWNFPQASGRSRPVGFLADGYPVTRNRLFRQTRWRICRKRSCGSATSASPITSRLARNAPSHFVRPRPEGIREPDQERNLALRTKYSDNKKRILPTLLLGRVTLNLAELQNLSIVESILAAFVLLAATLGIGVACAQSSENPIH